MEIFTTSLSPRFRQTDSAGLLFFNEAFNIFHDAYEEWVLALYGGKKGWFENEDWGVPLKKANADFRRPLRAFDPCEIKIKLIAVRESSFQLESTLWQNQSLCCTIETVHVFIDKMTRAARSIPDEIREKLVVNEN
jgi:1,4-dihydroxy-2-naphthoyl-CoA hydrolase